MRSSLGKGLSQLLGEQADVAPSEVELTAIVPNRRQPREKFSEEALRELAESIKAFGVLQPLVVRPIAEGKFELIAGERRWRASQIAGLKSVPVVIRSADSKATLEMALVENVQREDITPLESARAYQRLSEEFGLKQDEIAIRVAKSRTSIANTMRILKLPERVLQGLEDDRITEGHARAILGAEGSAAQLAIYDLVLQNGLSVRETEQLAKPKVLRPKAPKADTADIDPAWRAIQQSLSERLGSPVKLQGNESGGKIMIDFYSEEDLSRILEAIGID